MKSQAISILIRIWVALLLLMQTQLLSAQVAWLQPADPSPTEPIILTYDSNKGNQGLKDYEGTVYLHTGAITNNSLDGSDWKHVTGNWGEDDPRVRMTSIGGGLYQFQFVIQSFYGLRSDEIIQQLAFVFRDEQGGRVGKTKDNEDIFLAVNGYHPPRVESASFNYTKRSYLSHHFHNDTLDILTDHGLSRLIAYSPKMVEVRHFKTNQPTADSSDAIILRPETAGLELGENRFWLLLQSDSLQIAIHKDPFYCAFVYHNDTLLMEERGFFQRSDNDGLRFKKENTEKFYGLGERANAFDLSGYRYNLYNRPKYGYEIGARNLNYSIPLLISSKQYALLFDNPQKGYADIAEKEAHILELGSIGGLMKYVFIAGSSYKDLSAQYASLTGFQPMPPRWALGNLQSRMAYRTQYETDSVVKLMQEKDFPLDAIILDFYWFGDSILGTLGRLKWYEPNWPDPERMIREFSSKGVKTILITEPYILDSLENFRIADSLGILATDDTGKSYINYGFYFGNGGLIDIFKPSARQWFWEQYTPQIEKGIAGWWGDLGEPENHPSDMVHISGKADEVHNIYGHYWHKMLFEKYREHYPDKRLFNLNRAGYAGSQRYAIFPWTGDVSRSWGGLQAQLPLMLHMSMSGLPFIHSDAGGFAQGTLNDELYTRWLQMACFSPILRPHGSGIPSEPIYFSELSQQIVRHFMKLRNSLHPYLYTLAAEAHQNGYPLARPLYFEFPDDKNGYDIGDEYMLGPSLLVVPITEADQQRRRLYLPDGCNWYSFWDDQKYQGGQWIEVDVTIENIPIFVKAGSFIPLIPSINSLDLYSSANLIINYYAGPENACEEYEVYEDDGKTVNPIIKQQYEYIQLGQYAINKLTRGFHFGHRGYHYTGKPPQRNMHIEIIGLEGGMNRLFYFADEAGGQIKELQQSDTHKKSGYYYDQQTHRWLIDFIWEQEEVNIHTCMK